MIKLFEIGCAWGLILLGLFVFGYVGVYCCLYRGVLFLINEAAYSLTNLATGILQVLLFFSFTYIAFLILKFEGKIVDNFLERRQERYDEMNSD